ncbi:MAG TPA: Gfo/Idh/MocA family oxidoreductase [Rhodothermales bacterium]|nr:Gfo/Idh/MocA family oxidoreductase [Rhodothermales bacterium]
MAKRWRVGMVGLGHWYSAYGLARALPEYTKAELVAVACPDREKLDAFADTFHLDRHEDYRSLLERDDIDVVQIVPPVSEIPSCTILAAETGKHIILGKPMAMTLAEADRMVEAVERTGVVCLPFQGIMRLRYAGLKEQVARGDVGDLVLMHQKARWSIAEDWYRSGTPGWFADPRYVPGGALIDEGIYWMDFFRWLAGSEVVEVEARTANLVHKDIGVEDWGLAIFAFASGVTATLEASWTINAPRKTGPSPKQNSVHRLEVIGTRGEIIDQRPGTPGRAILAAGAESWVFEQPAGELFGPPVPGPLDHLITCIESGTEPVETIREARDTFVVAMAAYESARTGRPVRPA